ncbi:MAG: lipopolysaccharide biosynthesis protein [Bacteroidales bacterium]|nr:lipopolysaccharide biosynthesis protein [Bacteroidales bacterium]
MSPKGKVSENSGRIAKNTLLLYFRMLLLMLIGLFTSRIVLQALGVEDYGTYNVVGGVVNMFTIITASVSAAISRYLAYELGRGDGAKLQRIFSTGIIIQAGMCLLLLLFTETAGIWFLHNKMDIPAGRMGAAQWTLQCSMGVLMASLLSVPFNAEIIAHEDMGAFALISILEAVLKLSVALALRFSAFDKLKLYALLMLGVALLVRGSYGVFCRRHYAECRSKIVYDGSLVREMAGFAGWNFLGSGVFLVNTQGLNILTNTFFGVAMNAARGVAAQVENIVKQFVNNVVIAINPQITKSWGAGDREYSFTLVAKGSKYACLIILFFAVPIFFEAQYLLELWLGKVPEHSADFTRLTLLCVLMDLVCTTFSTLILATGRIKWFYIITSLINILIFPLTYLAFSRGMEADWAYIFFIAVYLVSDSAKLLILHRQTGFPAGRYLCRVILPVLLCCCIGLAAAWVAKRFVTEEPWSLASVLASSTLALGLSSWFFALSPGEREFVVSKLGRCIKISKK